MPKTRAQKPLVSVVVVNYNGKPHLATCFQSLLKTQYPSDRLELIMVDAGSTDGSLEFMATHFPQVIVLKAEINNYAASNNLGIARSHGAYVTLLNNDTRVDPGWLEPLIELMEQDPTIGAAGSKILSMDGQRLISVGHMELPNYYWADRGYQEPDEGQYDQIADVPSLCAAAACYRRACLDQVGLLDEDFVIYVEDVDFGMRCRAKAWRLVAVPESRVYHVMNGTITADNARRWWERNRLLFVAKHHPEHLAVAWHGQGYYRPGSYQHGDGRGAEALGAVVTKLIKEHGIECATPILPTLFHALDQTVHGDVNAWVQRWHATSQEVEQHLATIRTLSEERAVLETRVAVMTHEAEQRRTDLDVERAATMATQQEADLHRAELEKQLAALGAQLEALAQQAEVERRDGEAKQAGWEAERTAHETQHAADQAALQEMRQQLVQAHAATEQQRAEFEAQHTAADAAHAAEVRAAQEEFRTQQRVQEDQILRLKAQLASTREAAAAAQQHWQSQEDQWRAEERSLRDTLGEQHRLLAETTTRAQSLEVRGYERDADLIRLQNELAVIDHRIRRVLVVKAQQVPLAELERWLAAFRQRCSQTRVGVFANLVPEEYERMMTLETIDEPWLFCPQRQPLTWRVFCQLLPRIWWKRYQRVIVPVGNVNGYGGFTKAVRLARLMTFRQPRRVPFLCRDHALLSEAVAQSSTVVPGESAEYTIGLTNPSARVQRVRLKVWYVRLQDDPHQHNEVSRFDALLDLPPRATHAVVLRYDWAGRCDVAANGSLVHLDEWQQVSQPDPTVYRIRIELTDPLDRRLDHCELFQRVSERT